MTSVISDATGTNNVLISIKRVSRNVTLLLLGVLIAAILFLCMKSLITHSEDELKMPSERGQLNFIRIKPPEKPMNKKNKPKAPPLPKPAPLPPAMPSFDLQTPVLEAIPLAAPSDIPQLSMNGFGFNLGAKQEGEYLPIVKVAPLYPQKALDRAIEGHCTVEYTVNKDGSVGDISVIESLCTSWLFHKPSINAAQRFRYQPKVVNGQPVAVFGLRNQFTYQLKP
ncbi:energy transducer TonB [Endozoicomonas ascidiicola]|uniref:energy transducer TonB n=1 Tax=Endozoicomonas ascidiicola TaxID=1698521 RepID=UPI000834F1A6|nr:energy transducer TonB [Endozoicomonas ascidiicola]